MLKCIQGIEGKKIGMVLKPWNKRVIFKLNSCPDVFLTKEQEDYILGPEVKMPGGWKIERIEGIEEPAKAEEKLKIKKAKKEVKA